MHLLSLMVALVVALAATVASAQDFVDSVKAELPGEPRLIANARVDALALSTPTGDAPGGLASAELVAVEGQQFDRALRVVVNEVGDTPYAAQVFTPTLATPPARGDKVAVVLWARATASDDESGEGRFDTRLQLNTEPWDTLAAGAFSFGRDWKRVVIGGEAQGDYAAGDVVVTLHVSGEAQTLEIGPVLVFNLGPDADLTALPATPIDYPGRAADAPWRQAAAERIERIRKGDLAVTVIETDGTPVEGATVDVRMTRHAFGFGSFAEGAMVDDSESGERYRQVFAELFNMGTCPIYWADWGWEDAATREKYIARAEWLRDHHMRVRGHTGVWPGWRWMPTRVQSLADKPDELDALIKLHLRDMLATTAPYQWESYDLVNEPRVNRDVMDILGDDVMTEWWTLAEEINPKPLYFLNDYSILTNGGSTDSERAVFKEWIERLEDAGAPLGGIGFQGHFGSTLTDPAKVVAILDEFAAYDLPIHVTEFDIDTLDEQAQADYTRDFYTAVFSHESAEAIVMWGFWEAIQWRPNGAMFRSDWTSKPNAQAYKALVFGEWWTDESVDTDADGLIELRGFCGDYEIVASKDGRQATTVARLSRDGTQLLIVLPSASE